MVALISISKAFCLRYLDCKFHRNFFSRWKNQNASQISNVSLPPFAWWLFGCWGWWCFLFCWPIIIELGFLTMWKPGRPIRPRWMEEPVTQRVIFSTCLSRAVMVAFRSRRDSICVRPSICVRASKGMIYRHLFNGTSNALQIQYCPNHILVSFCHLSYTWTLWVPPPPSCHRVVTRQLPTGFSY